LFGLLFSPEVVSEIFLRNVGYLTTDYRQLYSRKHEYKKKIFLEIVGHLKKQLLLGE
jgi:hypothetical protein